MGVVLTFFLSSIISYSLSLGDGLILTEMLSQRAVKPKINQSINQKHKSLTILCFMSFSELE